MTQKKLSIAVIQQSPDLGGAEIFMMTLVKELKNQGNKVLVSTNKGRFMTELKKNNITAYENPLVLDVTGDYKGLIKSILFLPKAFIFYIGFINKLKKEGVDIILMSGFSEKMLVSFLSLFYSLPLIWIEYGPLEKILSRNFYIPKILYRVLSKVPKKIIVPTFNTKKSLVLSGHVPLPMIEVIPCGISIPRNIKKKKYPGWENNIIIGCTSRLTQEKGQQYLIRAIPRIIEKIPNARFLFVGDGPDKEYFLKLSKELHMEQYVVFTGFVKKAEDYYSYMDIFVFPSVWVLEGFGLVMVEAMAYKVPVIANDFGPVPELVNERVGIKVDIKSKKDFVQAVITLCKNKTPKSYLGEEGRKRAKKEYDIKRIAGLYEKIFYNAL